VTAAHWLLKSEPDVYSIDRLARDKRAFWDGVRNYAARNNLRAMKKGDLGFFYHSNADPSVIVGVVRVVGEARADPSQFEEGDPMHYDPKSKRDDPTWSGVDVEFVEKLARPVALDEMKKVAALKKMELLRISRLSVSKVSAAEWRAVLALAKQKPP
jgi:predicted RNA-binding protein with PUA-like domain